MIKKIFSVLIVLVILNISLNVNAMSAKSAVLIDPLTKEVLYDLNSHEKMSMASTTKLMTSLIATEYMLENGNDMVLVNDEMVQVEGSSMGLREGDKVFVSDLIIGMLLPSGNDAANSVALHIAESFEDFAVLMNTRARQIGMKDTNFVTPSGLDADEHYGTAYDMALLMSECINLPELKNVLSMKTANVKYYSSLKNREVTVTFTNHNKLLSYYEFCTGGKTGYTKQSGRCLVTSANKNNCPLVAVTFNAPDDWNDHVEMYNVGYEKVKEIKFEEQNLKLDFAEGGSLNINIEEKVMYSISSSEIKRKIYLPKFIYSSSYKIGEVIGYVRYYQDDKLIEEKEIIKE